MTKRNAALIPLTHDHHHALVRARKLIAASGSDASTRAREAESFLRFYEQDTLLHFHDEEEVLFPRLLDNLPEPPVELTRVLLEHVRIHGLVAQLRAELADGAPNAEQLRRLGETLQSHVRFEEKALFPLIETVVPQESLEVMIFQDRDRSPSGRDP